MDLIGLVSLLAGAASLVVGMAALIVSVMFHRKSGQQLREEAASLRFLVNTLAHYLHDEGAIRAEFDREGNLIRVTRLQDEFALRQEKAEVTETPSEG